MESEQNDKPDTGLSTFDIDLDLKASDFIGDVPRQIPIMIVLFMIGWICFDGILKSEMCMEKFEDESDNQSAVTVSLIYNIGLGFAIGSAITSGISKDLISSEMRYIVTLAMGIVAIVAISSYTELDDCSDAKKIHRQKSIMYNILGFAIGVFVTGAANQLSLKSEYYYGSLFLASSIAVIGFTSMSINLADRCRNKATLTQVEKDSIGSFRTVAIILLVIALLALLSRAGTFYYFNRGS